MPHHPPAGERHSAPPPASIPIAGETGTPVVRAAETLDHHPDRCNAYDTVRIDLVTHDLGGLSTLDFELARQIDRIAPA